MDYIKEFAEPEIVGDANATAEVPEKPLYVPDDDSQMYKNSTYEIVSKVAYLIGVPKRIFDNEHEAPKPEIYAQLDLEKYARIIRHLCNITTSIERNFKRINNKMRMEYATILSMPEYVPTESINVLSEYGINFVKKSSTKLNQHIIEINKLIVDRINNCKPLFPLWINWEYVRDMFIMPNGLKEEGTADAANLYYSYMSCYPYQVYINWEPEPKGNIFYSDKKLITLMYQWHNDEFTEMSKVSDASGYVKGNIYEFIEGGEKVLILVDCENSDPYKLFATLTNLDYEYTQKISGIILCDDSHTATTWRILEEFVNIPVEHILIERVKQNKSLVDMRLAGRAFHEFYENKVDSFIIVSSDSDYWGLIESLPKARFLVMIEHGSCGPDLKNALTGAGIFFCYIDDFYSGNAETIKRQALIGEMKKYIDRTVGLNVNNMFAEALRATRIEMSDSEKNQFISKYIKTLQMVIDDNGDVKIQFKHK